jgi:hypothetical protein
LNRDPAQLVGQCQTCQLAKKTEHWALHPVGCSYLLLARCKYGFCV